MPASKRRHFETDTATGSAADAPAADESRVTILVADDEPEVRTYVGHVLRKYGYHVLEATDGVRALELAAQHSGPIHLLLTEVSMQRLDGCELHRRLNHQRPETRTLFMSGYVESALPPDAAFLPKPFAPHALVRKVNRVLRIRRSGNREDRTRCSAPPRPAQPHPDTTGTGES